MRKVSAGAVTCVASRRRRRRCSAGRCLESWDDGGTMTTAHVEKTAQALLADGKGILAADETVATLTRCFDALHIESTADSRRAYRELFFTTPGISALISGVVLHYETIRQRNARGIPLADLLAQQGIIPGIKVDHGVAPLARSPREYVTEGLDGLSRRLEQYRELGAR